MLLLLVLACRTKDAPGDSGFIDADNDGHTIETDCNDSNEFVHPDAEEICNGVDDNCNDEVDEGVRTAFYVDEDRDGYGTDATVEACEQPDQASEVDGDCDDANAETWPGATERCDGADNDCDGEADEDVQDTWYADADTDGWGDAASPLDDCDPPEGYVADSSDCDDSEANAYPTNVEVCDGIDNNCDGQTDEGVTETFFADADADGFGAGEGYELCELDEGYSDNDEDCDDDNLDVNPDAAELCNTIDDDCDGDIDEDDAADATTWYIDVDTDGYGSTTYSLTQCEQPSGYVADDTDCDDTDSAVNTDGVEVCDGQDNDCDGTSDNDDATDASTWYADGDSDSYGDATSTTTACDQPSGYVADDTDCDDTDADVNTDAQEVPEDGTDQNCDGYDGCYDLNCDSTADLLIPIHYDGAYGADSAIYYGSATGFSGTNSESMGGSSSLSAQSADFNNDGFMDVFLAGYYDGGYNVDSVVYYGSVSGFSSTDTDELPGHGTYGSLADDLDGDGYVDLVLASYNGGSATDSYVYYGAATGFTSTNREALPTNGAVYVVSSDLDADGYTDLVFCNHYAGGYSVNSHIYYGAATGFSTANRDAVPTYGCYGVATEDLNADGYHDIVFSNWAGSSSYLYWGTSGGYSTSYVDTLPTSSSAGSALEDFDGDGYIDIALASYSSTTKIFWNSSAGFSSTVYDSVGGTGSYTLDSADLDSDGYPDLLVPTYYQGGYSTNSYVYWGSASGFSDTDRDTLPTVGATRVAAGDLNADGYPEVVFSGYYSGSWSTTAATMVYYGSASGYSSTDSDSLSTAGDHGIPVLVGDTDW